MISARAGRLPYMVTSIHGGHSSTPERMRTTQWRLAGPLLRNAVSTYSGKPIEDADLTRQARLGDGRVIGDPK